MKTKARTENRSLHELMQSNLGALKNAMEGRISDDKWEGEAGEFGRNSEALREMIDAFGIEVDIAEFPRLRAQLEYEPDQGRETPGQRANSIGDETEEKQIIEEEEGSTGGRREDRTEVGNNAGESHRAEADAETRDEEEDKRRFPDQPKTGPCP